MDIKDSFMIEKGEKVYTKHGNVIGEFTRNIKSGDPIVSTDFKYCDGSNPEPHSEIQDEIIQFIRTRKLNPWYRGLDPLETE